MSAEEADPPMQSDNEIPNMNRKPKLLPSYATVHPAEVQWKNPIVLQTFGNMVPFEYTECAFDNEASWLEHVRNNFESESIGKDSNLS